MPGVLKKLTVTPFPDTTIGALVEGLDFSEPIPEDVSNELKQALHEHGVLVARGTNVTDETMIALGRQWGPLDNITAHKKAGRKMRLDNDEIFDVGNIDPDGNLITEADQLRISSARGNALWHADGGYNPRRSGISIIRAVEIPPPGTGGQTEFLDSRTAYEDLPQSKKDEIKDYVGMNTLLWNRKVANPDMDMFKDIDCTKVPLAKHRIAQIHEPTGRGNLYVGSYNHHIEGLPVEEGRRIIDELFAHVQQEKYKLAVHYEGPGDVVFWDNTAVLHRATIGPYAGKFRRDMRRISTFDDSKWGYGENDPVSSQQIGLN
jgi:alpha-ketoglutarate-dependent 2,4-dichlorophenoxyacetate dioxygenase